MFFSALPLSKDLLEAVFVLTEPTKEACCMKVERRAGGQSGLLGKESERSRGAVGTRSPPARGVPFRHVRSTCEHVQMSMGTNECLPSMHSPNAFKSNILSMFYRPGPAPVVWNTLTEKTKTQGLTFSQRFLHLEGMAMRLHT